MSRIYNIEQARANRDRWGRRRLTEGYNAVGATVRRSWTATMPDKLQRPSLQRRICMYGLPPASDLILTVFHVAAMFVSQHRFKQPSFPKVKPHAPNTLHTPRRSGLSFIGRLKQSLWILGARWKDRDVKYAFKAGMGMAILAVPAFFDSTRPVFMDYRGEWALISVCRATVYIHYCIKFTSLQFFLVISPTIGAVSIRTYLFLADL